MPWMLISSIFHEGDGERARRQHRVDAAARARGLLAVGAVARAQLGDRLADGVADGAAQAATGERGGHGLVSFRHRRER